MIIKSMARKASTFGQLITYIGRDPGFAFGFECLSDDHGPSRDEAFVFGAARWIAQEPIIQAGNWEYLHNSRRPPPPSILVQFLDDHRSERLKRRA